MSESESTCPWAWPRAHRLRPPPRSFPTTGKHPLWPLCGTVAVLLAAPLVAAAGAAAPQISNASAQPSTFAVGASRGTTFRYDLSKPATVFFFFDRFERGRRIGGRCRRETRRNRRGHRTCVIYAPSSNFHVRGGRGSNATRFSGRVGRLTLQPSRYRVKVIAVDDMGTPSIPPTVLRFTVVRG
jgi:hypothetical protein